MNVRRGWLVLSLALALGACTRSTAPPGKPLVVATFYPLYEFSRQVAGDRAEVVSLVPPGVEPHDWEPSPRDAVQVEKARLFVYNGAGFEPWVDRLLRGGVELGRAVSATEGLPLISADLPRHRNERVSDEAAGNEPGPNPTRPDPHTWLDPVLAGEEVERIEAALQKVDPAGASAYAENARVFRQKLAELHAAFERGLQACARRDLVTSHAAFGYLAKRYGLTVVPVMGLAPESEPSAAQMAAIVQFVRRRQVRYIFFETLVSSRLAETLAREAGAGTLVLNPIEGLTKTEQAAGQGYVELMEQNLKNLRIGLECR